MKRTVTILLACVLLLVVMAWVTRIDPVRDRAVGLCQPCDVSAAEVDQWIDDCRHSVLDREGLHDLWLATFSDRDRVLAEPCEPCVKAVLDAAGR